MLLGCISILVLEEPYRTTRELEDKIVCESWARSRATLQPSLSLSRSKSFGFGLLPVDEGVTSKTIHFCYQHMPVYEIFHQNSGRMEVDRALAPTWSPLQHLLSLISYSLECFLVSTECVAKAFHEEIALGSYNYLLEFLPVKGGITFFSLGFPEYWSLSTLVSSSEYDPQRYYFHLNTPPESLQLQVGVVVLPEHFLLRPRHVDYQLIEALMKVLHIAAASTRECYCLHPLRFAATPLEAPTLE